MQPDELQRHILTLANLEEAPEPVVSCYLDLSAGYRENMNERVRSLERELDRRMRVPFWEALGRIEVFLGAGVRPESRGAAVFARGGDRAFFLPLQFGDVLPTRVTVGARPHIYQLVALRHAGMQVSWADEKENLALLESLDREMSASGLAVGGTVASLKALKDGRASVLLLSKCYAPDPGWVCWACGEVQIACQRPRECTSCSGKLLRELNLKEELVRVAVQQNRPIGILEHGDGLKALAGIGCLLSRQASERFDRPAA